ncbi:MULTISPECIES: VOC family protein [unclassified Variovorax]|uniref:VOC family protein n=1 Tax=unclassified Variovorax TaxID=663243 RepID=UPI0008D17EB3|nr:MULTISPECIES: VOC family protein [unclassified Variovorax]SEI91779.1 Glyoxalase-like domain-containing protein [Variovorax sp. OK202]SFB83992.1 Glyoxalase-like domain-containing protein [Variovorax sp. OK212]
MHAQLDHLVIAAASLDEGVAWCEATLGVAPGPGGAHPLMGTHNRLLNIASDAFPAAYLEIIAIEPGKRPSRPRTHRWFDLDDAALQAALAQRGPRLIHFVARVPDAQAATHALAHEEHAHIDRGHLVAASRDTPAGRLEWQITLRDDGQRLFYGALPTLIQWGPVHPTDAMPESGLAMRALRAAHPRAPALAAALSAIGMSDMPVDAGPPNLVAVLDTPRGPVTLESKGL